MLNNTHPLSPVHSKLALCAVVAILLFFIPSMTHGASTSTGGLPVRIKIPYLGVDSRIEHAGVSSEGSMIGPKYRNNVAWFQPGIRPGEYGSAVIAGHYGWKSRLRSVFDKLHTLRVGDKVYVEDDRGTVTVFTVQKIKKFGKQEDTTEIFFSKDGKQHLNLITCEGIWNAAAGSYSGRLVVFTDISTE